MVTCPFKEVEAELKQEEAEPQIKKPTATDITNMFKFATQQVLDALRGRQSRIFQVVVEANSVLWVPVGFWVVEKPVNLDQFRLAHRTIVQGASL